MSVERFQSDITSNAGSYHLGEEVVLLGIYADQGLMTKGESSNKLRATL